MCAGTLERVAREGIGGGVTKMLVCGSRDYADKERLFAVLDSLWRPAVRAIPEMEPVSAIIEGCAHGADRLAEEWAVSRGVVCLHRPADWAQHGRKAGVIRNAQMLGEHPQFVVAFLADRANPSKGTQHMIDLAKERHFLVFYG